MGFFTYDLDNLLKKSKLHFETTNTHIDAVLHTEEVYAICNKTCDSYFDYITPKMFLHLRNFNIISAYVLFAAENIFRLIWTTP